MSDTQQYILRWGGREIGPYSLDEINRQLDDHKIGMGHEILSAGEWITLEQFFASHHAPVVAAATVSRPAPAPSSGVRLPKLPFATSPPADSAAAEEAGKTPAQIATPQALDLSAARPRRRLVYALLGILLGFTGIHNYYARHWLTGLLQMLLSVATFLLGFGVVASWVWAVVEAALVRRDGNDLEMI